MALTVSQPDSLSKFFSGNPIVITAHSDIGSNVPVLCTIQITDSTGKHYNWSGYGYTNSSGDVIFNLQEQIHSMMCAMPLDFPPVGETGITVPENTIIYNPLIQFMEISGDPPTTGSPVALDPIFIIKGGIAWERFPSLDYLNDYQPSYKKFITWEPVNRCVRKDTPIFLTMMINWTGITSVAVKMKLTDTTGAHSTHTIQTTAGTSFILFDIACGYSVFDGDSLLISGHTAAYFEIWAVDNTGAEVTETLKFVIDNNYYRNNRLFFWRNSIGGMSMMHATGMSEIKSEITKTIANKYDDYNYAVMDGQRLQTNLQEQLIIKCNSGYKTMDEAVYYRDQLLVEKLFEQVNGKYLPVQITTASNPIYNEDQNLFMFTFEYGYAFKNRFFTPLV